MPSSGGQAPVPGRRPPSSGPPPIPSREDLGEAPVDAASSIKKQSRDDSGSPKLKPKGRPEITIVSARPMDSTGVIPPPSVTSPAAPEIPKVPQKPSRKPKGREPPPRPKSRPVSELTLGTDERDEGSMSREGDGAEVGGNTRETKALKAPIIPPVGSPVVPPRKMPKVNANPSDTSGENSNPSLDDESELSCKVGTVKDDHAVKRPVPTKPTVVGAKAKESTQHDSKPSDETDGVKETKLDSNPVPVEGATTAPKKIKPTVIIAPKPAKKKEPETEAPKGKGEGQEPSNETVSAVTGGKPPPPAKKPKPPVKAKPSSALGTPSKPSPEDNKPDTTAVPKPRMGPTVIAPKMNDAAKPDEESSKSKEESQARLKPAAAVAPVEAKQQVHDEEKTTPAPSVKPKRGPTIIRAPRPDVQDTGEERKPPRRPQRGPSIRAPPRRPVSAPAEGDKEQGKQAADGQNEPATRVQEKGQRPQRPMSIPGVKEDETLKDTKKLKETASPVEELTAMTRKGSRKRPPPPRPPTVEPVEEKMDSTLETKNKTEDVDDKSKARTRPPARRPPPAVDNASDKEVSAPEILDKTALQDSDEKSEKKNRPPRPASKVLEDKPSKHLHGGETEKRERETQEKPKPVRPAPVAPDESSVTNKNVHEPETRTVAESTRDDHVQESTHAPDLTTEIHEKENSERASSKAKPKPVRPPSVTSTTKKKPHRPSAPVAKAPKEPVETTAPTQVSSVCETYIEPSAIALYDYEPTAIEDLSFNAGDEIVLLKRIDDEWYIGRLGDQEGMFPVKFVEIIEDLPKEKEPETKPVIAPESSPFDVMSLYDFHGNEGDGELVFTAGETIHVIEKINDDWLIGEYLGKTGTFPCGFVDISTELIDKLPRRETSETVSKGSEGESNEQELDLYCNALFDYISDVPGDLSFHAGDMIKIKKKISQEWFEGEINGHVGMFPAAYVEMVKEVPQKKSHPDESEHREIEYGTALYDFTGTAADELSFRKGDKIQIIERVGEDWLRGKHGGREGMLPRVYVQLSTVEPESTIKNDSLTPKAKALFDFDGEYEDELSVRAGDVIVLLERVNDKWFQGELNKKVGRFPVEFVEILTPLS